MMTRRASLPSVSFLFVVALVTVASAATAPSGWRGTYKVSGKAKAQVRHDGEFESLTFPATRAMQVYGAKLDIGDTNFSYDDVTATFQHSRYIPWKTKNGGYNAFATAPVTVRNDDNETFTFNGKFIGRLAQNSAGKPVLTVKFTIFGLSNGVKFNVTYPLKGVKK